MRPPGKIDIFEEDFNWTLGFTQTQSNPRLCGSIRRVLNRVMSRDTSAETKLRELEKVQWEEVSSEVYIDLLFDVHFVFRAAEAVMEDFERYPQKSQREALY